MTSEGENLPAIRPLQWETAPEMRLGDIVAWGFAFSIAVNLLLLVSPLYMLQIYDRVMTSGSVDALIWLSVMAIGLLAIYAAAEAGRRRVFSLAGDRFGMIFSRRVFDRYLHRATTQPRLAHNLSLVSRIQAVLQSAVPAAFFDLPFAPLFLVLLAGLHPVLGIIGLIGVGLVLLVAILSDFQSRRAGRSALADELVARRFAEGLERQHSAIVSMGLGPGARERWVEKGTLARVAATEASTIDGGYAGFARSIRQILQIAALGVGAYLALHQQMSAGGIVAGSILLGRALAPIDQLVGGWRGVVRARAAWVELRGELVPGPSAETTYITRLPRPEPRLSIRRLSVVVPETARELVRPFSLEVEPGSVIALMGPNGSGKSSMLQLLSGAVGPRSGEVYLGGRNLHAWPAEDRGRFVGYLPQAVELLPASVRDNIVRLCDAPDEGLFEAARLVGAHEATLNLPEGYETQVGQGGVHLSAGQAQLIGLARAFYGDPPAIFLDEPSANLDDLSAVNLARAIKRQSEAGCLVVLATHDPRLLAIASSMLLIRNASVLTAPAADYLRAVQANSQERRA